MKRDMIIYPVNVINIEGEDIIKDTFILRTNIMYMTDNNTSVVGL